MTVGDPVFGGGRNVMWLCKMAGFLARQGFSVEGIAAALKSENVVSCSPLLEESEVRRIATQAVAFETAESAERFESIDLRLALVERDGGLSSCVIAAAQPAAAIPRLSTVERRLLLAFSGLDAHGQPRLTEGQSAGCVP